MSGGLITLKRTDEGEQEETIARLRGVVRDAELRLEDTIETYEQKIRYLKQEIEMKRL